jgi:hypothetical protein
MRASPFPLFDDWLFAISVLDSQRPLDMDKPRFLPEASEPGIL